MKKRLFFLIALMCCFVLAACALSACNESGGAGQQTPDGGQPGTETPEQPGGEDPGDEPGEEVIQYRLVYAAASGGSIDGATEQTVEEGEHGTAVTAVPDEGYEFVRWSDGRTDNPRTDSNVTSDVNATAEFRRIELTLTYTAGAGGSITGETSQTVLYGESGTAVTAVPDEGYEFVRWSDGVATATRTDSNVTSDVNVTAEFRHIELTLTYTAGAGGSITGETSQTVLYGESGTAVTAVPDEGYEFVRWSDGVATATRTDSNVTSDVNVTAEFRHIELTLTYTAGTGGSITGETSQAVFYGESGTAVTAVPDEGYEFVRWSDGVKNNPRTDSNVKGNITVTAEFKIIEFSITYAAENGGRIIGLASQTIIRGENGSEVIAVAEEGYKFTKWSDGILTAART